MIQAATQPTQATRWQIRQLVLKHYGSLMVLGLSTLLFLLALMWIGVDLRMIKRAYVGDQVDTLVSSWLIHQATDNLLHGDLTRSTMFYGEPVPFALTNGMFGVAILTMPLYFLTGKNLILTQNIYLILSFPLTAWAAYLWIQQALRIRPIYAVIGALLITFTPLRFYHIPRIELDLMAFFFVMLIALHKLIDQPRVRWAVVLGMCFAFSMLISAYMSYIFLVLAAIIMLFVLFRHTALITRSLLAHLALAGVLGIALVLPFVLFRFRNPTFTAGHSLDAIVYFAPNLSDWFTGFSHLYRPTQGNPQELGWQIERSMFLGFIVPTLSVLGWLWRKQNDDPRTEALSRSEMLTLYAIVTIAGYILALGPLLKWNEKPLIPLPYLLLMWIPGFSGIRFPERFFFLAVFGTGLLTAYALHALSRRFTPQVYASVLAVILAGLLVEYLPFNGDTSRSIPGQHPDARHTQLQMRPLEPHPPIYDWLADQPPGTPVFHYPQNISEEMRAQSTLRMDPLAAHQYAAYQPLHDQPMIGGIASLYPDWYFKLHWDPFPNPEVMTFLRDRGARYIIVHHELMTGRDSHILQVQMEDYQAMWGPLRFVDRVGDAEIYELVPGDFTFYEFNQPLPGAWNWFPPIESEDGVTHQQSTVSDSRLEVHIQHPIDRSVRLRVVALSDHRLLAAMRFSVNGVEIPLKIEHRELDGGVLSGSIPASALRAAPALNTLRFYLGDEALDVFAPTFALDWVRLEPSD